MRTALPLEIRARAEAIGQDAGPRRRRRGLADDVRLNSLNGVIAAAKLGDEGATLGVVAREMSRCASGMAGAVDDFSEVARP